MKYRIHTWLNSATNEPIYGIEGQLNKGERYKHCLHSFPDKARALLYSDLDICKKHVKALNNDKYPDLMEGIFQDGNFN